MFVSDGCVIGFNKVVNTQTSIHSLYIWLACWSFQYGARALLDIDAERNAPSRYIKFLAFVDYAKR